MLVLFAATFALTSGADCTAYTDLPGCDLTTAQLTEVAQDSACDLGADGSAANAPSLGSGVASAEACAKLAVVDANNECKGQYITFQTTGGNCWCIANDHSCDESDLFTSHHYMGSATGFTVYKVNLAGTMGNACAGTANNECYGNLGCAAGSNSCTNEDIGGDGEGCIVGHTCETNLACNLNILCETATNLGGTGEPCKAGTWDGNLWDQGTQCDTSGDVCDIEAPVEGIVTVSGTCRAKAAGDFGEACKSNNVCDGWSTNDPDGADEFRQVPMRCDSDSICVHRVNGDEDMPCIDSTTCTGNDLVCDTATAGTLCRQNPCNGLSKSATCSNNGDPTISADFLTCPCECDAGYSQSDCSNAGSALNQGSPGYVASSFAASIVAAGLIL